MDITALIAHGGAGTVTLFVMALLLGALHGLEPGHSKTMMAAYIVAVRGTAFEAVLLGVSAAVSHSIVVWVLAILGLLYGDDLIAEEMEPVFMTVSGGIFLAIALWFFLRLRGERRAAGRHGQSSPPSRPRFGGRPRPGPCRRHRAAPRPGPDRHTADGRVRPDRRVDTLSRRHHGPDPVPQHRPVLARRDAGLGVQHRPRPDARGGRRPPRRSARAWPPAGRLGSTGPWSGRPTPRRRSSPSSAC